MFKYLTVKDSKKCFPMVATIGKLNKMAAIFFEPLELKNIWYSSPQCILLLKIHRNMCLPHPPSFK